MKIVVTDDVVTNNELNLEQMTIYSKKAICGAKFYRRKMCLNFLALFSCYLGEGLTDDGCVGGEATDQLSRPRLIEERHILRRSK